MLASRDNLPLLAELLAEQQRLETPVARFSEAQRAGSVAQLTALATQLIPISRPQTGEQYAFEVDLDSCTGCKSCVAACHSLNGLDDTETWRDVSVFVSPSRARPFTQTITSACHHCDNPGCLDGCPVLAYEKDPVTGIVRHLDDQCIGCSYCILKCPYDVPKYSERLGIVRKCDMCHSRLAAGEAPACAQACPTHAIRIVIVSRSQTGGAKPESGNRKPEDRRITGGDAHPREGHRDLDTPNGLGPPLSCPPPPDSGLRFPADALRPPVSASPTPVSGLPPSSYTRPTTRYLTRRKLPDRLVPAAAAPRPSPPHWPLVIMLTLMPAAIGLGCAAVFLRIYAGETVTPHVTLTSCVAGTVGLAASVFHLGRPSRAWRIFLGWRRSWLSREALVFGLWLGLALSALFAPVLAIPSVLAGVGGLACSAMIYVDTHRHFWRAAQTFPRFFGTATVLGLAPLAPRLAAGLLVLKLAWEWRTVYDHTVSARLQKGALRHASSARDALATLGLVLLVAFPGWTSLVTLFAGELAERYLFFRAVDAAQVTLGDA